MAEKGKNDERIENIGEAQEWAKLEEEERAYRKNLPEIERRKKIRKEIIKQFDERENTQQEASIQGKKMTNEQQQRTGTQQGGSTFGTKILTALKGPQKIHESIHEITATYSPWLLLLPIALLWLDFFTGFNGICIKGDLGTGCQFASWDFAKFILGFFISASYLAALAILIVVRGWPTLKGLIYYSLSSVLFFAALVMGGSSIIILFHLAFAGFVYIYILKGFEKEQDITQSHWIFLLLFAMDMFFFPALYGLNILTSNLLIFNVITSRLLLPIWFFYILSFIREGFGKTFITIIVVLFYIGYLGVYMYPYVQTQLAEIPQQQKSEFINAPFKAVKNYWLGITEIIERRLEYATGGLYRSQVENNQFEPLGVFFDRVKAAQPRFYTDEDVTLWATIKSRTLSDPVTINFTCFRWKDNKRYSIAKEDKVYPPNPFTVYTLEDKDVECTFTPDTNNPKLQAGTNTITLSATYNFATSAYQKVYFIDRDRQRAMIRENLDPLKEFGITDKTPATIHTNGPVEIAVDIQYLMPVTDESGVNPAFGVMLKNRDKITDKQGKPVGEWQGKIKKINELVIVLPKGITIDETSCRPVKFDKIDNTEQFCTSSCLHVIYFPCIEKCEKFERDSNEKQNCIQDCSKLSENVEADKKCNEECSYLFKGDQNEQNYVGYKLNIDELNKRTKDEYKDIDKFKTFLCRIVPTKDVLENVPITTKFIRVRARYDYLLEKSYSVPVEQAPVIPVTYIPSNIDIDMYLKNKNSSLTGIGQCIKDAEQKTNIPSSVILSIAVHESNYGKSNLAQQSKNLFGIKCSKDYIENKCTFANKKECCAAYEKSKLDIEYEPDAPNVYRAYPDWCPSVNDFVDVVSSYERYREAMKYTNNPEEMIRKIKEAGYATDPQWANKVISLMKDTQTYIASISKETKKA